MQSQYDVTGIGNALMDVIAPVADSFLTEHNIPKGGMALIDEARALQLDPLLRKATVTETAGGSAANTLAGIAELGLRAAYLGKVASDPTGRAYQREMAASGLNFITRPGKSPATGRCLIAVTPDGERSMSTYLGISPQFTKADIDDELIRASQITYLEGYLFNDEATKAAFVHAAETARSAGRKVAITLSDSFCVESHRASFRQFAEKQADILFANEAEALALYDTDTLYDVVDHLELTNTLAFITRSEKGALVVDQHHRHEVPTKFVTNLIDTTGAGDQFAAGALSGLVMGMDSSDAAHLGNLAASEVIQHYGPRPEGSVHQLAVGN
jgi:sugar/nucleoside kinase (ribokinase family)